MLIEKIGDDCTGCAVCKNICKRNCISMVQNREGFLYPVINRSNCIRCGECERKCVALQRKKMSELETVPINSTFLGYSRSESVRRYSTSGGIFYELAHKILLMNGVVYGASYDDNYRVIHTRVTCIQELYKLNGSKYVQSEMGNIYRKLEADLKNGKVVLFSGCGCQVAGLKSYLGNRYDNLYTVAIICHGVPSPGVWEAYISKFGNIQKVNFRDKSNGWLDYVFTIVTTKKMYMWKELENPYTYAFAKDTIIRESCYNCKFKSYRCEADLMIGDAWGVQYGYRKMYHKEGTSLIITYTAHGKMLLDNIADNIKIEQVYGIDLYRANPRIVRSIQMTNGRKEFRKLSNYFSLKTSLYILFVKGKWCEKKNRNLNIS